jgi:hypothetical protein
MAVIAPTRQAFAQTTTWSVSTGADLSDALAAAFQNNVNNPSLVNTITLGASISGSSQWIVNANVNILGGGYTIDMQNADRAFFIAGGAVNIANLTIANGNAAGGLGGNGGGGGAGLGGAIFVGSGTYSAFDGSVGASGLSAPSLTLTNLTFLGNQATGGNSPIVNSSQAQGGGGGGMGGVGGSTIAQPSGVGAGGGGFGNGASGGNSNFFEQLPGETGALVNVSGTNTSGGYGGPGAEAPGLPGGANGGGGGGGATGGDAGSGGGGGIGGERGYYQDSTTPNNGGNGGFGGGGGGSGLFTGGSGGFGGGGGAGSGQADLTPYTGYGGPGGFGGGGGAVMHGNTSGGPGGFGAGHGANAEGAGGGGGGGLGAGGAIFVMSGASVTIQGGSFSGNSVTSGTGYYSGSAYGADVFLGANATFDVSAGESLSLAGIGGAGNLADPNVVDHATDPNAQGGIIKTGQGAVVLTGSSFYTGATTIHSGTLALAAGALEQGTTVVTVGQNAGDVATLMLGSSSDLNLGGFNGAGGTDAPIVIAQNAGSTGTILIGDGAGSSGADLGARIITGGAGTATIRFTQQFAAGSLSDTVYPFYTTLTGSLALVQDAVGTTSLQPLYGANTFVGPVTVNSGTLMTSGSVAALANVTSLTVNSGGVLALGQVGGIANLPSLTLAGGILEIATDMTQNLGVFTVSGSTAAIDFLGNAATLNFATLDLGGHLSIWNYSGGIDFFEIATGTATGSLEQISFYSDAGTTFLGYGGFESTRIVPVAVPEPSTIVMALAGLAAGGMLRWRRKRVASPRVSSPA